MKTCEVCGAELVRSTAHEVVKQGPLDGSEQGREVALESLRCPNGHPVDQDGRLISGG